MSTTNLSQHESLMTMAVDRNKNTINITDVKSGLQSDAFCVVCNSQLIAKKGEIKTHHFAHINGTECKYWRETFIHLAVKKYLSETKSIRLPRYYMDSVPAQEAMDFTFTDCVVEKRLDSIVPDICLIADNGTKLIVEVAVTHFCDDVKIEKIKHLNISCVEIDLSKFKGCKSIGVDEIKYILELGVYIKWLFHRKLSTAQKLIDTIKAEINSIDKELGKECPSKIKYSCEFTHTVKTTFYGKKVINKSACPIAQITCSGCKYNASADSDSNKVYYYVDCAYETREAFNEFVRRNREAISYYNSRQGDLTKRLKELQSNLKRVSEQLFNGENTLPSILKTDNLLRAYQNNQNDTFSIITIIN